MSSSGHHERALQLLQLASVCASAAGAAVLVHHVHTLRAELAALKEQTTTTATTTTTTSAAADAADDAADAAAGAAKPEAFAMPPPPPLRKVTFADVGGYANEVRRLLSLVQPALTSRRVFTSLGVVPPRALLLRGPPGSGKKTLAMALASRCFASFSQFSGPEVASTDGDTLMKMLFDIREREQPAIVYVQDIDALWQVDPVKQVVTSPQLILLLHFLDDLAVDDRVVVIASTTKVAPTPPLLVKYGRFDHTVLLGMPSPDDLVDIVRVACRGRSLADDALPDSDGMRALIAAHLHGGIVPADVHRLVDAAALRAINDNSKLPTALSVVTNTSASGGGGGGGGSGSQASTSSSAFSGAAAVYRRQIHLEHFREAVKHDFRPNLIRDRWIEKPNVRWEDIGGLDHIRSRIEEIIKFPLRYRSLFARFGIPRKSGVLLFGPPGVGKTMVAKAIASECQANFLSLQTSELLSSYYSQSASNLRAVFENARAAAPCVIFFDEFDSIARARGGRGGGGGGGGGGGDDDGGGGSGGGGDDSGGGGGGSSSTENEDTRLVNELLTQMDGLTSTADVFVVAATNRPTLLDPAVLRSGRLDSLLFIDLPNADGRESILETYLRKAKGVRTGAPAAASADDAVAADGAGASSGDGDDGSDGSDDTRLRSAELTALTAGCSGADLANLYRQAFHVAIRQCLNDGRDPETSLTLTSEHFRTALACVRRSVSRDDIALCKVFDERFGQVHAIVDDKAAASGGETKK